MPQAEDDLELKIFLASITNCWDYRLMPPCLVDRYKVYVLHTYGECALYTYCIQLITTLTLLTLEDT